uniref:Uncharacterized protein n=1 Tax=Plectus sambesii TaxID=2011161 RepID=A0A914V6I4_9BILA
MIWFDAEYFCRSNLTSAHLTSISSAFETSNINALIGGTSGISTELWIGAYDMQINGSFVWIDGKQLQYTNWGPGQPDLSKQCVVLLPQSSGKWKTESCDMKNSFVCEYYQSGESSSSATFTTSSGTMRTTGTPSPGTTSQAGQQPTDCYDLLHKQGVTKSGNYTIYPPGIAPFQVYCDMDTSGGGWTVFQKRQDSSFPFWARSWADYKNGFGNGLDRNAWLGLDRIHILSTKDTSVVLHVDLYGNRCEGHSACGSTDFDPDGHWFGEWGFSIASEADYYRIHLKKGATGTLSTNSKNPFYEDSDGQTFTTIDKQTDHSGHANCASKDLYGQGAWWYPPKCGDVFLNGEYNPPHWGPYGFSWHRYGSDHDYYINPVRSEMKLRRNF